MTLYHIRFVLNGKWTTQERYGKDMGECLSKTKTELKSAHGDKMGGIMICGPQSDGIYNF